MGCEAEGASIRPEAIRALVREGLTARKMTERFAILLRYIVMGFAIGIGCAAVMLTAHPPTNIGQAIGQFVGSVLGSVVVVGLIGYFRARPIPSDVKSEPAISNRSRKLVIVVGLLIAATFAVLAVVYR